MRVVFSVFLVGMSLFLLFLGKSYAQETSFTPDEKPSYFTGRVETILEEHLVDPEKKLYTQKAEVKRDDTGELVTVEIGSEFQPLNETQLLEVGRKVVLSEQQITPEETSIVLSDTYRLSTIAWLAILFAIVVVIVGKMQGLGSLIGMAVSMLILIKFIVPQILGGADPIVTSLIGSLAIGSLTLYIAHGFHMKSHIALISMLVTLAVVAGLAYTSVMAAQLVGLGSEEAYFLQFGNTNTINLQGLLLGGIILGALGVLDDITVSQVSVVFQLRAAKKEIDVRELYFRGLAVGRDHVASLVNTLVLVYAGANFPLFLLFMLNDQVPQWVILNSEAIVEEVIRTLSGSIGLVLAVPLTTILAAVVVSKLPLDKVEKGHKQSHAH